jgi:hypothetical protein
MTISIKFAKMDNQRDSNRRIPMNISTRDQPKLADHDE